MGKKKILPQVKNLTPKMSTRPFTCDLNFTTPRGCMLDRLFVHLDLKCTFLARNTCQYSSFKKMQCIY